MLVLKEVLTWVFCLYTHIFHLSYIQRGVVSEAQWFHHVFPLVTQDRKHWQSMLCLSVICLIKPSHLKPWLNMLSISTSLVSPDWENDGLFLHSYCWLQSKKSFCLKLTLSIKVSARGSLILRDRYFAVIHGLSKWRCYVYICMQHMPYSQSTLSPAPVCLHYDFSPDNNGSKCQSLSHVTIFLWSDHAHKVTKTERNPDTKSDSSCISVIIYLLLLRTKVKHF